MTQIFKTNDKTIERQNNFVLTFYSFNIFIYKFFILV